MFSKFIGKKIALYGLGTETKKALHDLEADYEIIGLLDSFKTDGRLYGKDIIAFDDAIKREVKLIIIVARPGSCRAITKGIGDRCCEKGIALMDIRGKNLLEVPKVSYCFSGINGAARAELEEKIDNADVVSFDLFDTLVMRQTLFSDDVIAYVDCQLREKGVCIQDFCRKRLESEKELSRDAAPTLIAIYQNMLEKLENGNKGDLTAEKLADLEWKVDFKLLVPRKDVCNIFKETVGCGKRVYIVSDTYYSRNQLVRILEKCDITKYTDIMSSSDYRAGKAKGLYEVLKARERSRRYLHIGDDIVSDVENARNCGFDTYRVFSGRDLLEEVGGLGLLDCMDSLSDHLKVGMFVAGIFNSPFQFESSHRHIEIEDVYDIGYLLCAPVISDFTFWFYDKMKEQKFQNIWFGARDGYLIKKMYGYLLKSIGQEDKTVYFLTSRTAAIRAGVRDEEDIRYVDEMKFSGTLTENLQERFGIDSDSIKSGDILAEENGLLKYKYVIMEKACREYENYQKYIEKLNVREGDIAFFDFVAKGTIQMYIQRLIDKRLIGFYFLQLEKEHMKGKELYIQSFYEDEEMGVCAVYDNYYILEPILTATHPSVREFDDTGEPVYALETRSDRDIQCIERVQEGIFDYFKTCLELYPKAEREINRKLDEVFLELIHKVKITDSSFKDLIVEDSFFNRMTNLNDII